MPFSFNFSSMPKLQPKLLKTQNKRFLPRLLAGRKRRMFYLTENWLVTIKGCKFADRINGDVVIPKEYRGEKLKFDGASVPFPWLVTFLSFGLLRPLGVMLTASIVHDFAFYYGGLLVKQNDGELKLQQIERHQADRLFREIIKDVNHTPVWAFIAWFAVRLGWLWLPYNGERFAGKTPWGVLISTFLMLLAAGYCAIKALA